MDKAESLPKLAALAAVRGPAAAWMQAALVALAERSKMDRYSGQASA